MSYEETAHLQVVLLAGVQGVTGEVRLELYVVFKRLIRGREGHRREKLNRQTTEQTKKREEPEQKTGAGRRKNKSTREKEKVELKRSERRGSWVFVLKLKGTACFHCEESGSLPYCYKPWKQNPTQTQTPRSPPLTEYMALTMREAVDTLPESSSRLWVSLVMVSTLMSGLPSVTPRRPASTNAPRMKITKQLDCWRLWSWMSFHELWEVKDNHHPYTGGDINSF